MDMREAITACRERLFAVVGRLHGCWQPRARPSSLRLGRRHHRLALAGLDHQKPGPWKASWKDSPEPRPMRETILKVLLICGCRFADQQIAACGSTKVGCCGQSRSNGGSSEGGVSVSFSGGVWLSSVAVGGEDSTIEFRIRYCHGQASSPRTSCERRADPGLGRRG